MFTTIFFTLAALVVAALYIYNRVRRTRKTVQFYWNEHAGRFAILHRRFYKEWGGLVQDGTRSIGPPFRVSWAIFSIRAHGRLMGLVTRHPWFVRDPNLFVPYVSEKYYSYKNQEEKLEIHDSNHLFEIDDWHQTLANSFEYWVKGLRFWEKLALMFGERHEIFELLKPEPIYQTRAYDKPVSIGGGLVRFRVALSHTGIYDRFVTVIGGAQVGWNKLTILYLRRSTIRDPHTSRPVVQYFPLTAREADKMVEEGLARIYIG